MANLPIVLPLAETIDRRGSEFQRGLGNARVSSTAAAIEGAISGIKDGADITAKILDTRRNNDPRRIEAELVNAELRNEVLKESVTNARITNQISARTADTQVAQAAANLDATRTRTDISRRQNTESRLNLRDQNIRSTIAARNESIRQGQLRVTQENIDLDNRRNELNNAILEEKLAVIAEQNITGALPDKEAEKNFRSGTEQIQKIAKTKNELRSTLADLRGERNAPLRESIQQDINKLESLENSITKNLVSNQISRREAAAAQINNQLSTDNATVGLTNRQTATRTRRNIVADGAVNVATQGAADIDAMGTPNYRAGLGSMNKLAELARRADTPEEQDLREREITGILKDFGGAEAIQAYIEEDIKDPEEKKKLKRALFEAAVASGNLDVLAPEQKNIVQSGLGIDSAADPEKAYDTTIKAMRQGISNVDDPEFKKAMRTSIYFAAAQEVSKGGNAPFTTTVSTVPPQQTEPGVDVAGQTAQPAETMMIFRSADGTSKAVRMPANEQEEAQLSFIEDVSKQHNNNVEATETANARVANIEANKQQGVAPQTQQPADQAAAQPQQQANPEVQENANFVLDSLGVEGEPSKPLIKFSQELGKAVADGEINTAFFSRDDKNVIEDTVDALIDDSFKKLPDSAKAALKKEASELAASRASGFNASASLVTPERVYADKVREEARTQVRNAVDDVINAARLKNTIQEKDLERAIAGEKSFGKKAALRIELDALRENKKLGMSEAQIRAMDVEARQMQEALIAAGAELTPERLEDIRRISMRNVFNNIPANLRAVVTNTDDE